EHRRAADVAGMQDEIDAREDRGDLRPHEAVRVGDQADRHLWYRRSAGVDAATHAVASRQPTPPVITENGAPNQFATTPASSSPSCGPPMKNTMFTPVIRPRRRSGVSS